MAEEGRLARSFSGPTAARITGVTYQTLDYWARTDLLRPSIADASGTGTRRAYSFEDLVAIRTVKALREQGLSLQKIRVVVRELRRQMPGRGANTALASSVLLTDGERVYLVKDAHEVWQIVSGGAQAMLAVALGQLISELQQAVRPHRKEEGKRRQLIRRTA